MVQPSQMDTVVARLIRLGSPKDPRLHKFMCSEFPSSMFFEAFVMLVLLCSWLNFAQLGRKSYDLVEAFAGRAELSRSCRKCNMYAAAADLSYDNHAFRKGGMDLTQRHQALCLLPAVNPTTRCVGQAFLLMVPIDRCIQNCTHNRGCWFFLYSGYALIHPWHSSPCVAHPL